MIDLRGLSPLLCYITRPQANCCSVAQCCPTLCDPTDCSRPGLPVHHQLPEFTQTHVHWVSDAIQPPHPLTPSSPSVLSLSQHQGLFQCLVCSHQWQEYRRFTSASVIPVNIQGWPPLRLTGLANNYSEIKKTVLIRIRNFRIKNYWLLLLSIIIRINCFDLIRIRKLWSGHEIW